MSLVLLFYIYLISYDLSEKERLLCTLDLVVYHILVIDLKGELIPHKGICLIFQWFTSLDFLTTIILVN
jgi:hypothetical protein